MGFQPSEEEGKFATEKLERIKKVVPMLLEFAELNKISRGELRGAVILYLCGDFMSDGEDLDELQYFIRHTWKMLSKSQDKK